MAKIISMFSHKGGVSKTTTAFNLGWMLATLGHKVILVDADPQCNLTGASLGLINSWPPDGPYFGETNELDEEEFGKIQNETRDFFTENLDRTLYGSLKPAFESEPVMLEPVDCFPISERPGLYLLPGHLQLGEYEVSLSIAQEMSGSLLPLKNVPGAINYLLRKTAENIDADYVVVDMSPSLGSLNQNLVAISDLLVVPTTPDFFSIMALKSLARVLPRWHKWAERASENEVLRTATYAFPKPNLKFAGAVIQRYRLYRKATKEDLFGTPTGPFMQWIERVTGSIDQDLFPALASAGLTFPEEVYQSAGMSGHVLARIQEFHSLLPKSQEHRVPVFALRSEHLGTQGVVLAGSQAQIEVFNAIFENFAKGVEYLARQ
ncbi:ParA family protein [Amycolatopsis sp. cmx-11-32]|uniref:ParA family protein n=1 Tax=Amycolatopsis sp. cmx-11-32 TaxID=2785796 RepID=UPI0039E540E7